MNLSRYLFSEFQRTDMLAASMVTGATVIGVLVLSTRPDTSGAAIMLTTHFGVFNSVLFALSLQLFKRRYEIAVLRLLGAKRVDILETIILRSVVIACIGLIIGVATAILLASLMQYATETLSIVIPAATTLIASICGGIGAGNTFWNIKTAEVMRD